MNTHEELVRELKSLRKGRGVHAGRIGERIGPALRVLCGVAKDDGPVTIREKLVARLAELAEQLPEDLRLVTVAAFGLTADVRMPLYQDRVGWAAPRIDRDTRTVRRRVDEALDQLAELMVTIPPLPDGAWHTAELNVVVTLDRPQHEVLEQYRVVADRDGLYELDFTSPAFELRGPLEVDVLYGGTLRAGGAARGRVSFTPPEPLAKGETHAFAVRYRFPRPQVLRSYVVRELEQPCELFDLRVRFARYHIPRQVWTLRDATGSHGGHQQRVDRAGEIHQRFRRLSPGRSYGARWDGDEVENELYEQHCSCADRSAPRNTGSAEEQVWNVS
ncbi:hypothetical protein CFP71_40495 [Amycolatopsis thailandensis]|uniref:Uncharacterized protein n=1 Tax=Amycolatopsis thailandensis TaxID=589330 RepID=A0A229RD42_9PSEU|nr:hypothetical protein [Amycolatopsis thailandensis]OXM44344.1 hypothetical protein CFP71_40495 [Amycolatopsis thailandensis]